MRESRPYGSVRGDRGNPVPYRDNAFQLTPARRQPWVVAGRGDAATTGSVSAETSSPNAIRPWTRKFSAWTHWGEYLFGRYSIGRPPVAFGIQGPSPFCNDTARFRARSTSHTVAAHDGCTNIPLAAGKGSGRREPFSKAAF